MHPGRSTAGSTRLSVEQQRRMEENKIKAQAKLAAKRVASSNLQPQSDAQAPPPAKKPACATTAASTSSMSSYKNKRSHPNSAEADHLCSNATKHLNPFATKSSHMSNIQGSYQGSYHTTDDTFSTGSKTNFQSTQTTTAGVQKPPFYPKLSTSHSPISFSSLHEVTSNTTKCTETKASSFFSKPHGNGSSISTSAPNMYPKPSSAPVSQKHSSLISNSHPPPVKYTQLQETKKARVYMVSKTRYEVCVQYDHELIEIFKKMPTRAYSESIMFFKLFYATIHSVCHGNNAMCT